MPQPPPVLITPKRKRTIAPASMSPDKQTSSEQQLSSLPSNGSDSQSCAPVRHERSRNKLEYIDRKPIDTEKKLADWYESTPTNEKHSRGDLQTVSHVRSIIQACVEAASNIGGDPNRYFEDLRTRLHQMEFYPFLTPIIVKKSRVLEEDGFPLIFSDPYKAVFPWDIVADAQVLWKRWMSGNLEASIYKGLLTTQGTLKNGKTRMSYKLDPDYGFKKSANVSGANNLMNGQWWPSRITTIRDGAHGETEAGISGKRGEGGAHSIVISAQGYANEDSLDVSADQMSTHI